ncbi:MAG: hypothetical protein V4660_16300, partial [Pseudomonadota bacterium]
MKLFAHRSHIAFLSIFLLMNFSVSVFANTEILNAIQEKPRLTANDLKTSSTPSKSNDPLTGFGHGQFFGKGGAAFEPTPESVYEVQAYYLTKSTANINKVKDRRVLATLKKKKTLIYEAVSDKILANALYLDELLKLSVKTEDVVLMEMLDGLRRYHIEHFAKPSFRNEAGVFSKGIHPDIARKLEDGGITVFLKTNASGDEYIKECQEAGVPIPPPMYAAPWENRGVFSNEFIDTNK